MPNVTKSQIDEFIEDLAKTEELEEEEFGFDL
jgi:histidine decarboxylase